MLCLLRFICPIIVSTDVPIVLIIIRIKRFAEKKLTQEEIRREVIALQDMGHKRLALEAGEDPVNNPLNIFWKALKPSTAFSIKTALSAG